MDVDALLSDGVESLRYTWVDNANVIRSKAVYLPTAKDLQTDLDSAVRVTQSQLAVPVVADEVVLEAGILRTKDLILRPDWATLRILPWAPTYASVICGFYDGEVPADLCPRGFAERMAARAGAAGWDVRVGLEFEFVLLREGESGLAPVDTTAFGMETAYELDDGVIGEIVAALHDQGIPVAQFHPESGFGHWEISLSPVGLLTAADAVVVVRRTVHAIAGRHGMVASFLPVMSPTAAGSGLHLHVSLTGDDSDGLGPDGPAFIAGLLANLPALVGVCAPSSLSPVRFRPHFSVGAYQGWGVGNKEAPLRVIPSAAGAWRDVEFKAADATANPYIALGCLIAAGLDGVARGLDLPAELVGDPALLTPAERAAEGIVDMPSSALAGLAAFTESDVFRDALGATFHRVYSMVREVELRRLCAMSFDEQVDLLLRRI